ncbi:putative MscS family protein [Neolecta irregularis DAH-3]|uniref:Mechanosensitive ion channel protein n=1 Tax=Neolecta irregularis (strain DAH-3) TaxID=1198029 RepID=A0A1U7LPJ2_NEOID|nr:putative MscS family protein [Neolecta irregularis DAH-3]|eukprot:OLL24586.1 putative MscS family protein [Neolecta irregularis DAH-3]
MDKSNLFHPPPAHPAVAAAREFVPLTQYPSTTSSPSRPPIEKLASTYGRRGTRVLSASKTADPEAMNVMGRFYDRVLSYSIVTRYFMYIAPLAIALLILMFIGAWGNTGASIGGVRIVWIFFWIEISWLSLWGSKVVAKILPFLFKFIVGVVSVSTQKYATIIHALELPLTLVGWSGVTLISFYPIITQNPTQVAENDTVAKPWEIVTQNILGAGFVCCLVFLLEKIFVQVIAINFHKKSYEERITSNKWAINALTKLYSHSKALFPTFTSEFHNEDLILLGTTSSRNGSVMNLNKVLGGAKRAFNKATGVFGNAASEIVGRNVFRPDAPYSVVIDALTSKKKSQVLGRRIWMSFVEEGKDTLTLEDLYEVMGDDNDEAEKIFFLFDKDGNADISLEEMEMSVVGLGKERKAITRSMKDIDSAIRKLDDALQVIVFIVSIFVFVSFLNTNFNTTLATAGTTLLSLSFIFSVTAQEVLASIIFVFYKHAFDVGDRVDINGTCFVVQEINLLYTIFKRTDNGKITQIPNNILNSQWIENIRRSSSMTESISLNVNFNTSFEDIERLKAEMLAFVKGNSRDFKTDFDITVSEIPALDTMAISVSIQHKSNWQNDSLKSQRRNKFMCALVCALKEVGIGGPGPSLGAPSNPFTVVKKNTETVSSPPSNVGTTRDWLDVLSSPQPQRRSNTILTRNGNHVEVTIAGMGSRHVVPIAHEDLPAREADEETFVEESEDTSRLLQRAQTGRRHRRDSDLEYQSARL